jgi:hypothetical protein
MSEKRLDRGKLFKKLHQIQKRLFRSKQNPGHHTELEDMFLEIREKQLLEKIKGKSIKNGYEQEGLYKER